MPTYPPFESPPRTPENNLAWFHNQEKEQARRDRGEWPEPIGAGDLMRQPKPPVWYLRDHEYQYRKGFVQGYDEALQHVMTLYRDGFVRTSEITNILWNFLHVLSKWRRRVFGEDVDGNSFSYGFPRFKHDSWWRIRERVKQRDGHVCVVCGSNKRLEIHHRTAVADGGLPTDDNLCTLCFNCHRGVGD